MTWSPGSWRRFEARQQPDYPDADALAVACAELARRPALVDLAAIDMLTATLADAQAGRAFLLQGGDCAERLSDRPEEARAMAALLADLAAGVEGAGLPVVTVGRIAGQFAKPRSRPLETRDGTALPAWRGDSVNDMRFDPLARTPDPDRLIRAYEHALATLRNIAAPPTLYTSHEALVLPFEEALVRHDPESGRWFAGSGNFLWVGARTLFPGSAHIELLRGLANPIGLKCGPDLATDDLLRALDQLSPNRAPGRITLIVRLGQARLGEALPPLVRAITASGHPVLWCCDPLHGNTMLDRSGAKRRQMLDIEAEAANFFRVMAAQGAHPGGFHLEMTARQVAECDDGAVAGARDRDECRDPRLNPDQARRVARIAADALASRAALRPLALAAP